MKRGDDIGDVGGRDLVDPPRAEQRQHASELYAMADRGSVGDVDPRGAPALRNLGEGRRGAGMVVEATDARNAHRGELAGNPALTGQRVPSRCE